jgi:DNA-nicking Smr family endonuclease
VKRPRRRCLGRNRGGGDPDPIEAAPAVSKRARTPGRAGIHSKTFRIGESASAPSAPQPRHDVSDRVAQAPIRMKQTAHRRMIRGKMKPEARIDLHGMTLSEAHPALVDFVIGAHARGTCAFCS